MGFALCQPGDDEKSLASMHNEDAGQKCGFNMCLTKLRLHPVCFGSRKCVGNEHSAKPDFAILFLEVGLDTPILQLCALHFLLHHCTPDPESLKYEQTLLPHKHGYPVVKGE